MKHTQGDWEVFEAGVNLPSTNGRHEIHTYIEDQLVMIAEVSTGVFSTQCHEGTPQIPDYAITEDEALANARLIAAAPDLLRELEFLVDVLSTNLHDKLLIGPYAAINKARG